MSGPDGSLEVAFGQPFLLDEQDVWRFGALRLL